MAPQSLVHLLVPGRLDQRTGGYRYDARIVAELRDRGWTIAVDEVPGRFPDPDSVASDAVRDALGGLASGSLALVDGLCLVAAAPFLAEHRKRVRLVGLVHHPAALETGWDAPAARRLARAERDALARCHRVIATSAYSARGLLKDYGVGAGDIGVVEPGVDPAPLTRGGEPGAVSLLCVGTLTQRKGHVGLIEALAQLSTLDWRLTCAGSTARDPATAERVRLAIGEAGLTDQVTLAGELDDAALGALYATSDVLVSASHYEGYGMALTEALARGLPVVATAAGAVADTLPADAGLLVAPGDAAALATALREVIAEPAKRRALANGARRAREGLGTWAAAAAGFARELERALG